MYTKTTTITPSDVANNAWYAVDTPMQPPAPQWLIEGLLAQGELLLLTGTVAPVRTYVAIDLILALNEGVEWLTLPTRPSEVKYLKKHDRDVSFPWRRVAYHRHPEADTTADTSFSDINVFGDADLLALVEDTAPDVIVIDDLNAFTNGDKRRAALELAHFAERNHVAIVLLADEPLDGFDYLHVFRDTFQARWGEAIFESCRDDEARRIDVSLNTDDGSFFLMANADMPI